MRFDNWKKVCELYVEILFRLSVICDDFINEMAQMANLPLIPRFTYDAGWG